MTPEDDIGRLWREQRGEDGPMSLEEIKVRAKKLGRIIRMRNLLEYGAAAVVVLVILRRMAIATDPLLMRIGGWLILAAVGFVVYYMHTRGWVPTPATDGISVAYYRAELVRQRDLLRSVWWWYLLPFVPGFLLVTIGRVAAEPERAPRAAVGAMIGLGITLGIGLLNDRAAKKIQRDIDALDR
jgi:hypothetical protein